MGSIFSRRRQKTTIEILQDIDKEIDDLETNHADKEFNRRRSIGYLIIFSILLFVGVAIHSYVYLFPEKGLELRHYLIFVPLICVYPTLIWALKWSICWLYEQSLSTDERKLTRLRRRKRDILDTVKDKETYKVAKEILERFDPQVRQEKTAKRAREIQQQLAMIRRYASLDGDALTNPSSSASMQLRNRRNQQSRSPSPTPSLDSRKKRNSEQALPALPAPASDADTSSSIHPPTPQPSQVPTLAVNIIPPSAPRQPMMKPTGPIVGGATCRTPILNPNVRGPVTPATPCTGATIGHEAPSMMIQTPIRLPRPIVPQNRSAFDKMIDYLLGEGPSSRYALICQRCHSHNGMALKEELETMAFRCCYCFAFNPARKLAQPPPPLATSNADQSAQKSDIPESTTTSGVPTSSSPNQQGQSSSRAPSRCSIGSLDSTQSVPPFFRPVTNPDHGDDEDCLPTCTTTMASTNESTASGSTRRHLGQRRFDHYDDTRADELTETQEEKELGDEDRQDASSHGALPEEVRHTSVVEGDDSKDVLDFEELAEDALESEGGESDHDEESVGSAVH